MGGGVEGGVQSKPQCAEQEGVRLGWRAYVTGSDAACTSTEDKDWQGQRGSKETFECSVKNTDWTTSSGKMEANSHGLCRTVRSQPAVNIRILQLGQTEVVQHRVNQ